MTVPSNLVPTRITDLPVAPNPTSSATMVCVIGGITYQVQFIDLQSTVSVPASRLISTGGGLQGGGNLSQDRTLSIADAGVTTNKIAPTGVVAGTYGSASAIPIVTVNAQGQVTNVGTAAISLSGFVPDTRQIIAGNGLTGGGNLQANRTLSVDFGVSNPQALGSATPGVANTVSRSDHVHPAVDLADATETTGLLPLTRGGTGQQVLSLTAGAVWYNDGTNGFLQTAQGALGQVLVSGGPGAPSWGSALIVSNQPANFVYAGPTAGAPAATSFRALVNADIPTILTGKSMSGALNTFTAIPNASLDFSSVTFNGVSVALGASGTITAGTTAALTAGTGLQYNSGSTFDGLLAKTISIDSSVTTNSGVQTLTNKTIDGGTNTLQNIPNAALTNSSTTFNGVTVALGASGTITANTTNALTIGTGLQGTSFNGSTGVTIAIDSTVATLTGIQTFTNKTIDGGTNTLQNIPNAALTNSSLTVGTTAISLGGSSLTLGGLTSVAVTQDPVSALQLATKQYVDTLVSSGITYHTPVKYEVPNSTGNLNAIYNQPGGPGVGVGATLTNNGTLAAFAPDGPTAAPGDRILIYNQTNQFENGVYTVTTVGDGSTPWVLTRATDADTYALKDPNGLGNGDAFFITSGNTGAGETYVCNTVGVITFGTTAITFAQVSASQVYSAGTGLTLTGTQFSITNTGVSASTYGSASSVPVFAVNAQGQLTTVTNTPIAINGNQITSGTIGSPYISGSYTGITGVGTLTAGTWTASAIAAVYGGTGITSYSAGDLLYANTSTSLDRLTIGASNRILTSSGSAPSWTDPASITVGNATNATSATTATNLAGGVAGSVPYQSGIGATLFSAAGSLGEFLISGGTGSPTWTSTISGGTY
jgi:hypothetical protein